MQKSLAKTVIKKDAGPQVRSFKEIEVSRKNDLVSLAEKIAGDKLCYRNHYYPGGKNLFPEVATLQVVDKFYPYANGGPLFVDEWTDHDEKHRLSTIENKKEAMRKLGHRYLSVTPNMTELDAIEAMA